MCSKTITLAAATFLLLGSPAVFSQSNSKDQSTGPAVKSVTQPQGQTGPLNTESTGGAPASSPEGETPPAMQATPKGPNLPPRSDSSEKQGHKSKE